PRARAAGTRHREVVRRPARAARGRPGRGAREHRRAPRLQRRGQDHARADPVDARRARRGHRVSARARRRRSARAGPRVYLADRPVRRGRRGPHGPGEPRARRAPAPPARPRAGRGRPAGPVLADRRRRAPGRDLLRWDAPSPRHRDEPGREPAGRLPRRAHDGAGPAVTHRGVGHGARAGPWRHHGAAHHPVPRRGRAARGPDRDPAPWHDRPGRHARRAQGAAAARDGRVRREAAVPRGRVPRARRRRRHPRDADDHRGRPARRRGAPMTTHVLTDARVLTGRSLRHVLRSPDTIITTAVTPVALMLLFVYVLGGAIDTGTGGSYVDYLLPGILLITVASGVAYTSYRLFLDLQGGIVERFRSMPVARPSVLWAHVLTSLVANLVSVTLVVGVGLLLGFRTDASVGAWLAALGILVLF